MAKTSEPRIIKTIVHEQPTIKGALGRLGMTQPHVGTLMISASTKTKAAPEDVWRTWSEIENWPKWGNPFIVNSRWLERREWEVGAKFEQAHQWGFPFFHTVSIDIVKEVNPGQSVSWWKSAKGIRSCHIWFFEPLREGGTRIVKTEVFVGFSIWLFKPLLKKKWSKFFQDTVNGLARSAERAERPVESGTPLYDLSS